MPTTVTINNLYINGGAALIMSFDKGTLRIGGIQPTTIAEPRKARRARRQSGYQQDGSCPERAIQIDTDEVQPVQRRQRAPPVGRSGLGRGLSTVSSAPRSVRPRLTATTAPGSPQRAHTTATTSREHTAQDLLPPSSVPQAGSSRDLHEPSTYDHDHVEANATQATIRELGEEDENEMADNDYSSSGQDDDQPCDDMTCPCKRGAEDQNALKDEEDKGSRRTNGQ
ncbi:hypothetical protein BCV69DRAFT_143143 [Microstroma glucosiphilum]|uniref:Uncharacterized protein n=1 Tax=Pseudomicrostroma glucosiphilum TaxID=1684307 RepID=A0A316UDG9_9BASI|nr:hypothetical protein BCV69DRAFT_143143 [Pseudomicrostroma glucosiphilum]PWN22413.1 hypothetical protein BCV69DRAFT_143143 [Pseudomicrostroma glucosiphilum]